MTDNQPYDIEWLAFRYIANEMSNDEQTSFESQLANDQTAREAVARAVELTQAIALSESLTRTPQKDVTQLVASRSQVPSWLRSSVWMAVGATACLLLVAAFQTNFFKPVEDKPGETALGDSHQLAIAWSETTSDWPENSLTETDPVNVDTETPVVQTDADFETIVEEEIDTPSWMLLAVRAPVEEEHDEID